MYTIYNKKYNKEAIKKVTVKNPFYLSVVALVGSVGSVVSVVDQPQDFETPDE